MAVEQADPAEHLVLGLVPLSWGGFASLQELDLSGNCGLCGGLPAMATARVDVANTGLNDSCGTSGVGRCGSSSHSSLMVALSVLMGGLALCLLQRHLNYHTLGTARLLQQALQPLA
eukprot:gene8785-8963_t